MAEAFLGVVFANLNSLIQKKFGLLWGVHDEMKKLQSKLSTIQAVLADAEEKQVKNREIRDWLRKLKDAAYDADDILDECATAASRPRIWSGIHQYDVLFLHKIGKRMKKIRERFDEIARERTDFHLQEGVERSWRDEARDRRETSSILTQPQVYGREEDKERMVEFLVNHAIDREDVSIYPIIGIGGLGKTTLAQLVYKDERVKEHFEKNIWVCVSDDFNVKRVIRAIIQSAGGDAGSEALELEPLQRRLGELLNRKRYLLVLDDVWNEDQDEWERLKHVLACGSKGASIIITTRIEKVASIMGTLGEPYRLSSLSEEDCWSIFKQRAFGNEGEERPDLVAIGKEIVKKCGGVPLAAKALGGLLRFKREKSKWVEVNESEIWKLRDENSIMPALMLSYYNLPVEMRPCFSFCALFPKDSKIEKQTLIDLWMANGLLYTDGELELEDIGNDICDELHWRSFFQCAAKVVEYRSSFGRNHTTYFEMHDLMHDLAQSVMVDECCIMEVEKPTNIPKRIRHLSLVTNSTRLVTVPEALFHVESLWTILPLPMVSQFGWSSASFISSSKFGFLRVFVAAGSQVTELPSSIRKLIHLRYLDVSTTKIKLLPESICSLWNLQTLKIEKCRDLQRLPKQMSALRNLRHLYMYGCESLTQMPPNLGRLTCLKMLTIFIVGEKRGFRLGELQGLNLRGKLNITHLERVKDPKDAKDANLVGKKNLRGLQLSWESKDEAEMQGNAQQVLEALEPHPDLEMFAIDGYMSTHYPLWLRKSVLQNLVRIDFSNCKNCVELPPFGKMPSLGELVISGMNSVEYIDNESHSGEVGGFPSLESLHLFGLPILKRLSREEGRELLPRLTQLVIYDCPKLTVLPCLSSLKELHIRECNELLRSSISNRPSLVSLGVAGPNNETTSFPDGFLRNLPSLEWLQIEGFTKLVLLPADLVSLTALRTLRIRWCVELECLPEQGLGGLTSLQKLEIRCCRKLKSWSEGLQNLTALESLVFGGHRSLAALPEGLQHVSTLQSLHITDCPDVASLPNWLGNLTSLQSLHIESCPKVESLPTSIQSLTKLKTLTVEECPQLKRRCEKETGEDWYMISHVPNIHWVRC